MLTNCYGYLSAMLKMQKCSHFRDITT